MKKLKKCGTLEVNMMEATPFVFKGKFYRMEYIHAHYHGNRTGASYFRCIEVETGITLPPFGMGYGMGNMFIYNDRAYLTCVKGGCEPAPELQKNDTFYLMESDDLLHWSEPRPILHDPSWNGFNTSICRTDDKFVMVFELMTEVPFTMFFAESTDLEHWNIIDGACFGRDFYTGGPMLRWHGGYYYLFYLHKFDGEFRFETWVVRSRDLRNWEYAPGNPVLTSGPEDHVCAPGVKFSHYIMGTRLTYANNINNSDIDMCEWKDKLYITYSWGNQFYKDNMAYAEFDGPEREFCESFWM